MRYAVELELDKPEIPLDYHRSILSYLKFAFEQYEEGRFFEEYYGVGKKKAITFGVIFNKPNFERDTIVLQSTKIKMILSSHDKKTAFIYFNALLGVKGKKHAIRSGNALTLKGIRMERELKIQQNAALFKLTSALCLRRHEREVNKDRYVSVESKDFYEVLRKTIADQCLDYDDRLEPLVADLRIDAHQLRKTVVTFYGRKIEVSIGEIALFGDPRLLDAIYKMNLGSRRGAGFGLLSYVDQWEVN